MGKLTFGATGLSYQVEKVSIGGSGAPLCPRCNDRVYFNEERKAVGKTWHIKCFNCAKCKKKLDSTTLASNEDEIYCQHCHKKEFGPKGYGFAGGAAGLYAEVKASASATNGSLSSSVQKPAAVATSNERNPALAPKYLPNPNDPNSCPRCGKKVYFAEEVKALNKKFHRLCFKCGNCNKMLEPGRCSTHENDLYCNSCYGRKFGPKGYGFAGGAGTMLTPDIEKMTAGVTNPTSATVLEVTKKKQDPISRQQLEMVEVESRPKNLVNGVIYGASNSIFDSRKDQRPISGESSPSDMLQRVSPLPQDQQSVVLVPHERTRFSPNITREDVRSSPVSDKQTWSSEEFRRSPMPQDQRSQSSGSPAYQEDQRVNQISPMPQEQRTSPADRSVSPRYGSSLHPNGAYYNSSGGSVEELSKYNDPSIRSHSLGGQGGPNPIDHLLNNIYTRSENQKTGYAYTTGETGGPEVRSYEGDRQRSYHSVEDLSAYEEHNVSVSHAKSASMDGSQAYRGVGSDASVAAAVAAARAEYGHVDELPPYPNPTVPPSQSQYGHSAGPSIRQYQPEPQYVKNEYGPPPPPPPPVGQGSYGQNDGNYNPQYQPRSLETSTLHDYESVYRRSPQPPNYTQLESQAYSQSNAHGYRGQNEHNFSSAVDAVFSATMPKVHQ